MSEMEHRFRRTIATDGTWCVVCGLPEAQWNGGCCPGPAGSLERLERRLVGRYRPDTPFIAAGVSGTTPEDTNE